MTIHDIQTYIERYCVESDRLDHVQMDHLDQEVEAVNNSCRLGERHQLIEMSDLLEWCQMIGVEIDSERVEPLVIKLHSTLDDAGSLSEVELVETIADWLVEFHGVSDCGRVARLVSAYISGWGGVPPVMFCESDDQEYHDAIQNPLKMRLFVGQKLRNYVFGRGKVLMHAIEQDPLNRHYESEKGKGLIVQWNQLFQAEQGWDRESR